MTRTLGLLLLLWVLLFAGCSGIEGEDCAPEDLECYCEVNPENCQDGPAKSDSTSRTE